MIIPHRFPKHLYQGDRPNPFHVEYAIPDFGETKQGYVLYYNVYHQCFRERQSTSEQWQPSTNRHDVRQDSRLDDVPQ
jgi:hypothetical protein